MSPEDVKSPFRPVRPQAPYIRPEGEREVPAPAVVSPPEKPKRIGILGKVGAAIAAAVAIWGGGTPTPEIPPVWPTTTSLDPTAGGTSRAPVPLGAPVQDAWLTATETPASDGFVESLTVVELDRAQADELVRMCEDFSVPAKSVPRSPESQLFDVLIEYRRILLGIFVLWMIRTRTHKTEEKKVRIAYKDGRVREETITKEFSESKLPNKAIIEAVAKWFNFGVDDVTRLAKDAGATDEITG